MKKEEPNISNDNSEKKKCPYCAELIRSEAIKCRFCGEFLDDRTTIKNNNQATKVEDKEEDKSSWGWVMWLLIIGAIIAYNVFDSSEQYSNIPNYKTVLENKNKSEKVNFSRIKNDGIFCLVVARDKVYSKSKYGSCNKGDKRITKEVYYSYIYQGKKYIPYVKKTPTGQMVISDSTKSSGEKKGSYDPKSVDELENKSDKNNNKQDTDRNKKLDQKDKELDQKERELDLREKSVEALEERNQIERARDQWKTLKCLGFMFSGKGLINC